MSASSEHVIPPSPELRVCAAAAQELLPKPLPMKISRQLHQSTALNPRFAPTHAFLHSPFKNQNPKLFDGLTQHSRKNRSHGPQIPIPLLTNSAILRAEEREIGSEFGDFDGRG